MRKSQTKALLYMSDDMDLFLQIGACGTTLCEKYKDCKHRIRLEYFQEKVSPLFHTQYEYIQTNYTTAIVLVLPRYRPHGDGF